ncbi:MAG: hypothetical protein CMC35_03840 [Flavobacteriaceae bacterium]|nr:hypothetical protein [Flavobacteriaceae bacterium]|tara:strand:- start:18365 stop:19066 length:702 start_codon:yes stop_codon:yes gene_type:complete
MKTVHILFVLLGIYGISSAQDQPVNPNNNNLQAIGVFGANGNNIGTSSLVINPPEKVEGSVHLFERWNNTAIFTIPEREKQLFLRNINYNILRDRLESRIGKDSIFTFETGRIESVLINGRLFRNVYTPSMRASKMYEVIYENEDFAILKNYYLTIDEGSDNPMVNRPNKYAQHSQYYVKEGSSLKSFNPKKRTILDLVGSKADAVKEFANKNDLSYREDRDLHRMLTAVLDN